MNSPTKRFKRATGKLLRREIAAWINQPTQYGFLTGGVAVLVGLLLSFLVVALFY